jgi:lysophospholipase L1-like esterase
VLAENPRVVILLLGGNDYLQRIPKEETFANLGTIIGRVQEKGAAVLLLGVRGGAIRDTYEADFAKLARTHQTGYVSNVLDGLLNDRTLMSDAIHPNNAGYNIIAERVTKELRKSVLR